MSWDALEQAIAARDGVTFWWRDDDAAEPTRELERLLELAARYGAPLALAVVPNLADPRIFRALGEDVAVLQHGTDHRNRAAPGEKKTEFPAVEPDAAALARLADARARLGALAGARALPVLVPPWNRIRIDLAAKLPSIGLQGLSRDVAAPPAAASLKQVNTHVDIIAWHQGRRFIGEAEALGLALRCIERGVPAVGWLTHHAVHDAPAWRFLERLLGLAQVRWASAAELFSYTAPGHA